MSEFPLEAKSPRLQHACAHLLATALIGVLFTLTLFIGLDLGIGTVGAPGAGLWPVLGSVGGMVASAVLMFTTARGSKRITPSHLVFAGVSFLRVFYFVGSIAAFLVLYPLIGFIAAAIPVAFVLLRFAARAPWLSSTVTAILAPVILYIIFSELLNVRI